MSTTLLAKQDDPGLKRTQRDQIRRSNELVDGSISVAKRKLRKLKARISESSRGC
jgi:hypothetical protein